ncbi:MAG: hypothetical protein QF682_09660 [Candidatus Thermoplasmatota archaeon]|jgi:hypothetical protein|nr:hypothetical protein [Candidatus Thermoplasmatota archaeon]
MSRKGVLSREVDNLEIVTINDLVKALRNTLGKKGMGEDDIRSLAEYLINFFGFEDYAIDNRLNPNDRDVFYMLEEIGLLKTEREEVTIKRGQIWRIHYWKLNKQKIKELGKTQDTKDSKEGDKFAIYENIDKEMWTRSR